MPGATMVVNRTRRSALVLAAVAAIGVAADVVAERLAHDLAVAGVGQVVRFPSVDTAAGRELSTLEESTSAPVVMMHGMGDFGNNPMGMAPMRKRIAKATGSYVRSVELCSKPEQLEGCPVEDQSNGFLMNMDDQVEQFARVIRSDAKLSGGFNAIGFSQGNLIIRGYIHRYNSPPVRSFVSMHGVMMGVAGIPRCPLHFPGIGLLCKTVDRLASLGIYTSLVQRRLAQANYFRDPKRLDTYRKDGLFLPDINNEVHGMRNTTYADNFRSLERLVLVMAKDDTMVHPKQSEHFGYFRDGSMSDLVDMHGAPWYVEDWFGLRTLDEQKRIERYITPGDHLRFSDDFLMQVIQKYFVTAPAVVI
mmetsp:Transcript_83059/g.240348  ORF Transcript_83059/g.240348 Transcript_83059/m.240348 type:complete len:362 (-) Transcript_83059:131-1216(-)|eukprot:CAMPEP_0176043030 /NCGR_PEP_ID=MMETSP0120_2-20121206/21352_1 /TAXON_ID=160619 /ORGANISM="Kryptoperidinium foliaceum, Strain CCMP 1326" /LENGTH=361 /DNA_ID=CAMNT_0017376437 /DNA_START=44 /DNA_END=1129 /DNA_ORIENTATION=+